MVGMGRLWLGVILLLSACGSQNSGSVRECEECGFMVNEAGQIMAWPDGQQMRFVLASDFPADVGLTGTANSSVAAFNANLQRASITLGGSTGSPAYNANIQAAAGDGINTLYWVTGTWPFTESGGATAQGMTLVSFGETHVVSADIYMKASSFGPANGSSRTADELKRFQLVLTHEFAHALGRVHTSYPASIMNKQLLLSVHSTALGAYDLKVFEQAYVLQEGALALIASSGLFNKGLMGLMSSLSSSGSAETAATPVAWKQNAVAAEAGSSYDPRAVKTVITID